jgi:hypothetical protein
MTIKIWKKSKKKLPPNLQALVSRMVILFDKRCVFSLTVELVARALSNIRFEAVRKVELIRHSLNTHADRTGQGH